MKKVAILQSNYIPWKGYFDLIGSVDEFIIYDEMQFTKRDWRNRNLIKTPNGLKWLTIPVKVKGKFDQKISETLIDGNDWRNIHWKSITHNYRKAPFFNEISNLLEPFFLKKHDYLSQLNYALIQAVCSYLEIPTKLTQSSDYEIVNGKTERLVDICLQAKASIYISGPAAKNYIDENLFQNKGINLQWFEYSNYPEYHQLWDGFEHHVSIIDLLFNHGRNSTQFMKWKK